MSPLRAAAAALGLLATAAAQEQLHLSLTGVAGQMALDFVVSPSTATGVTVTLGTTPVPSDCVASTLNNTLHVEAQFCTALFTDLTAGATYSYVVSSSAGSSATYSFISEPSARPPIFAVYADFGLGNDESLKALVADAASGGFDAVIHAGDWVRG